MKQGDSKTVGNDDISLAQDAVHMAQDLRKKTAQVYKAARELRTKFGETLDDMVDAATNAHVNAEWVHAAAVEYYARCRIEGGEP